MSNKSGKKRQIKDPVSEDQLVTNFGKKDNFRSTIDLYVTNKLIVDSDTLFVNPTTNRVGVGTKDPQATLHVRGNTIFEGQVTYGSTGANFDIITSQKVNTVDILATGGITANTIYANNLGFSNIITGGLTATNGINTNSLNVTGGITADSIYSNTLQFSNISTNNINATGLSTLSGGVTGSFGNFGGSRISGISGTTLTYTTANITNLNITSGISANNSNFGSANITGLTGTTLIYTNINVINGITGSFGNFGGSRISGISGTTLTYVTANITNLNISSGISANNSNFGSANITGLTGITLNYVSIQTSGPINTRNIIYGVTLVSGTAINMDPNYYLWQFNSVGSVGATLPSVTSNSGLSYMISKIVSGGTLSINTSGSDSFSDGSKKINLINQYERIQLISGGPSGIWYFL